MSQMVVGKILKAAYSGAMAFLGSLATVLGDDTTISHLTAAIVTHCPAHPASPYVPPTAPNVKAGPSVGNGSPSKGGT